MKEFGLTIQEFRREYIEHKIRCHNLISIRTDPELENICDIKKIELERVEDFKILESDMLPRYRNEKNKVVNHYEKGSRIISLAEEVNICGVQESDKLKSLIRGGHTKDIEIISIYDFIKKKSLIVDGVHRAIALYYLYFRNQEFLENILSFNNKVYYVKFVSAESSNLFPSDFSKM